MRKTIIIISLIALGGCTTAWKPIVDVRASKEPRELTRDILECRELTAEIVGSKFSCWDKPFWKCDKESAPIRQCLINRGHSVLN